MCSRRHGRRRPSNCCLSELAVRADGWCSGFDVKLRGKAQSLVVPEGRRRQPMGPRFEPIRFSGGLQR